MTENGEQIPSSTQLSGAYNPKPILPCDSSAVPLLSFNESHKPIDECFKQCAKCGANVLRESGPYFGHYLCDDCGVHSKSVDTEDNSSVDTNIYVKKVMISDLFDVLIYLSLHQSEDTRNRVQ